MPQRPVISQGLSLRLRKRPVPLPAGGKKPPGQEVDHFFSGDLGGNFQLDGVFWPQEECKGCAMVFPRSIEFCVYLKGLPLSASMLGGRVAKHSNFAAEGSCPCLGT